MKEGEKMKNKLGVTTNCYAGFSLDEALNGITKTGAKYVELSAMYDICDAHADKIEHVMPEKMNDQDVSNLKDKLKELSLIPMSISGHVDLSKPESVMPQKRRIDIAKSLRADIVISKTGNPASKEEVDLFYKNVSEVADYASKNNIIVALETAGSFLSSAKKAAPILKKINSDYIRLTYDTANVIFYEGVRPDEDIEYAIQYLSYVHLKDKRGGKGVYEFPALGTGEVNFKKIFNIFSKNKYEGPLSIEVEFFKKPMVKDVDDAVQKSYEYIMGLLNS